MLQYDDQPFVNMDKTKLEEAIVFDRSNPISNKYLKYYEELGELSQVVLGYVGSTNKSQSSIGGSILEEAIDVFLVALDIRFYHFVKNSGKHFAPDIIYHTNLYFVKTIHDFNTREEESRNTKVPKITDLTLELGKVGLKLYTDQKLFKILNILWKIMAETGATETEIIDTMNTKISKWLNKIHKTLSQTEVKNVG